MEKVFFESGTHLVVGEQCFYFYSITLNQQIGPHPAGTKFTCALLNLEEGLLTLRWGKNCENEESYKLVVGERV